MSTTSNIFAEVTLSNKKAYTQSNNPEVFIGKSTWNTGGRFNSLDEAGITMDAIEQAYDRCITKNDLCILKNVFLVSDYKKEDGKRHLTMQATIHSIDNYRNLGRLEKSETSLTASSRTYNSTRLVAIDHLGVRKRALFEATAKCYKQSHDFCVILSTEMKQVPGDFF